MQQITPPINERHLRRSADRRIAHLCEQPVRNIRERREAFEKMFEMIRHTQEYATTHPGKLGIVYGDGFYVAHNGEHFIVRKGAEKVFQKSITMVAMYFDPLAFMSGHM